MIIYRFLYVNALIRWHKLGARSHKFEQIALQCERPLFLCRCFAIVLQVMETPCDGKVARLDAVNQGLRKRYKLASNFDHHRNARIYLIR